VRLLADHIRHDCSIRIEQVTEKSVWRLSNELETCQSARLEVLQIGRHDYGRASMDGQRQDMAIVGVICHFREQGLVAGRFSVRKDSVIW
jgi:hypothetical protein